jgi:hypothetical protein
VFGVGACAQAAGPAFIPAIPSALAALYAVVEAKDSRVDINEPATDNAISSIGKIILNFTHVLMPPAAATSGAASSTTSSPPAAAADATSKLPEIKPEFQLPKLVPWWLNCLPCVGDEEEAGVVHNQLCLFLEK